MDKYYTIKQVSEITGLSASNIRFYEKEGLIKNIARNTAGVRTFTREEVKWIEFLKRLKEMEVPISKMKEYTYLREQGDATATKRKELLQGHRVILLDKIKQINSEIKLLDDKIIYYEKLEQTAGSLDFSDICPEQLKNQE